MRIKICEDWISFHKDIIGSSLHELYVYVGSVPVFVKTCVSHINFFAEGKIHKNNMNKVILHKWNYLFSTL